MRWSITVPTEVVTVSITGLSPVTAISSVSPPTFSLTFWTAACATSRRRSETTVLWNPVLRISSR